MLGLFCRSYTSIVNRSGAVLHYSTRVRRVLGIETSCDDAAVAIVDSRRNVLYSKKMNDNSAVASLGGICPNLFALKHRTYVEEIIRDCVATSSLRLSDLDAVAVSTRPGLVVSLKVGVDKALGIARDHYLKLIPVHHMRAHAVVSRLLRSDISYPFLALLISGGHALIVLAKSVEKFQILGNSLGKSPGDCLDKVARALRLPPAGSHYAAALEKMTRRADKDGHLLYPVPLPVTPGAQFNFANIKSSYLNLISRMNPTEKELPNFCASVQFTVMSHICKKLDCVLQYLERNNALAEFGANPKFVISGGVASNVYLVGCIRKLVARYGFQTYSPPPRLCTDNGEMVAWLGMELLLSDSADIYEPDGLPDSIYLEAQSPIGESLVAEVCQRKPPHKLNARELHDETV